MTQELGYIFCTGVGFFIGLGVAWLIVRSLTKSVNSWKKTADTYEAAAQGWQNQAFNWKASFEKLQAQVREAMDGDNDRPTLH